MKTYTITNLNNTPTAELIDFVGLSLRQNFGVQADDFPGLVPFDGPPIRSGSDSDQYVNAVLAHTGWDQPDIVEHDGEFIVICYRDEKTVARIHEAPTGRWHITNDSLNYLNESGRSYKSEREAIKAARESGEYTHRVGPGGKVVKL